MRNLTKVSEILIKFCLFFLANWSKTYQSLDEKQRIKFGTTLSVFFFQMLLVILGPLNWPLNLLIYQAPTPVTRKQLGLYLFFTEH